MGKLTNQVAVVTGASKGIGADRVVQEVTARGGKAVPVQGEVSKQGDLTRLFAKTKKTYSKLNILVNNAGTDAFAPLDAITEELFHKQFNLNVLGLLLATKEVVKLIGPEGGSIINISSGVSTVFRPTHRHTWQRRLL